MCPNLLQCFQMNHSHWKVADALGAYMESQVYFWKSNPLSEHLLLHYLYSYFIFSPADFLSSKVCWIKFGFHLYPIAEIISPSCRREQKWIQSGFTCISVLWPWLSLLALRGIYLSLCEESVVWLMILVSMMMLVQVPAFITVIWYQMQI